MIIIIKSPQGSERAYSAIEEAAAMAADIVLMGPAAALAAKNMLEGFCGTAFALRSDIDLYLPHGSELEKGVKLLSKQELECLLREDDTLGPF